MATLFGKEIRKLRIDEDVTLRKMADGLGLSPSYLSSVETGKRALTDDVRDRIISFFHLEPVSVEKLKDLASKTNELVSINLSSLKGNQSETAILFARKVEHLSDEKAEELMRWLNDED